MKDPGSWSFAHTHTHTHTHTDREHFLQSPLLSLLEFNSDDRVELRASGPMRRGSLALEDNAPCKVIKVALSGEGSNREQAVCSILGV